MSLPSAIPRHAPSLFAGALALFAFGCARPAAPPPSPAAAPVAQESQIRSSRTLCDGKPCTLTIELSGNRGVPASVLFAAMRSLEDTSFEEEVLERDALMIASIYYDRGYVAVKVSRPGITRREGAVGVRFSIEEGAQYTIKSVQVYEDIQGVHKPPLGGWKSSFKPGDLFRRREFAIDLDWLRRIYQDEGYANVEAYPQTDLDEAKKQIAIVVPIVRGELASIGHIRFEGIGQLSEEDLRRQLSFREGERFSTTALERSLRHLRELGWFSRVDMSTRSGGRGSVDVTIEVTLLPTGLRGSAE